MVTETIDTEQNFGTVEVSYAEAHKHAMILQRKDYFCYSVWVQIDDIPRVIAELQTIYEQQKELTL